MNKNYTKVGEYTIVETDNGIKTMPTTDNISDILKQENKIEELKNKQKEINELLHEKQIEYPEYFFGIRITTFVLSITLITFVCRFLSTPYIDVAQGLSYGISLGLLLNGISDYIYNKKKQKKYSKEVEIIDYQLSEEKEKLYSLYKTKENEKNHTYETVNIENNKLYLDQVLSARNVYSNNKKKVKSRFNN